MGYLNCVSQAIGIKLSGEINGVNQFDDTESYGWIQWWCDKRYSQIQKLYFVCEKKTLGKLFFVIVF